MSVSPPGFEDRVVAVLDGTANRDQRSRFQADLRECPDLMDAYIEQGEIHAALLAMSETSEGSCVLESVNEGPQPNVSDRMFAGGGWWKVAAAAAALLAGVAVWHGTMGGHLPAKCGHGSEVSRRAAQAARTYATAQTRSTDAPVVMKRAWFAQGLVYGVGCFGLPKDDENPASARPFVRLESGAVTFGIGAGVTVTLCGPGEVRLTDDGLLLVRGYLVARTGAGGHGFSVRTVQARIVDFGTAFAVDARIEGVTEVTVTEGQVHVACLNDPVQETLLGSGQNACVETARLVAGEERFADVYPIGRQLRETQYKRLSVNTKEMLMNMVPNGVTVGIVAAFLAALPIDMQTLADTPALDATVAEEADAPGSTYTLQVDSDTTMAGLTISGTLIKTGLGTLTLRNSGFQEGGLNVRTGAAVLSAVTVASVTNDLPLYLRDSLSAWFDANRNVVLNPTNSTVDEWRDVRDDPTAEATNCVYTRAVRYGSDPTPGPSGALSALNGLQSLDFGVYGSGKWLNWVNPNGTVNRLSGIRTVFVVVAPPSGGMGFVLADWDQSGQGGGYKDFHKGSPASSAGGAVLSASEAPAAPGWAARLAGPRVNPTQTGYASGYQLLEVVTTNAIHLSNFCNDRNWRNGVGGYTGISRQGGALIGETLIFTRELSESERRAVEAYLNAKWFARTAVGAVTVAAGARVTAEVAASDEPLRLAGLRGAGVFEKTGAGRLSIGWFSDLFEGSTVLRAGTIDGNGVVGRVMPLALTEGGLSMDVVSNTVTVSAQSDSTAFLKTGDGVLGVSSVTDTITHLSVSAGTLRVQPELLATTRAEGVASLPNPSFETNTLSSSWSLTATAAGWGFMTAGLSNSGLTKGAGSGSPWCGAVMPEGSTGAFIQRKGSLTTQLTCLDAGVYKLSFWVVGRPNRTYGDQYVAAYVDGVMGGLITVSVTNQFVAYACVLPAMAQGAHELVIRGLRDDQDRCAVVDQLTIEPVHTGDYAMLPNQGFEFTSTVGAQHPSYPGSYYMYDAANAGWTFSVMTNAAGGQIGGSGITDASGTWVRTVPEGKRVAFLQQVGTMSTAVVFPEAGRYRLTFQAAARRSKPGLDFAVRLAGEELGRFQPLSESFNTYALVLPERSAGETNTLAFVGLNNGNDGLDRSTIFDQVIVERVTDLYDAGNGFEGGGSVWQFENAVNRSGIVRCGSAGDVSVIEGTNAALVQGTSVVGRSVTFATSGVYRISFAAAGRQAVSKNAFNYAHDFKVLFGGVEVGRVTTEDDVFGRYVFRLPHYATAGQAVELRFVGLNTQGRADSFSLIDDVRFEPVDAKAQETVIAKTTLVEVAQGALLDLDFAGTIKLDSVMFGGRAVSGVISAITQPTYVTGAGILYASPKGTCILVK